MKKALGLHARYPVIMAVALLFALSACDDSSSSAKESQEESGENASLCKDVPDDVFCDPRDGQLYRTAEFDGVVWTVENMNYYMAGSFCYDGVDSNCAKYGKLYDKVTIFRICKDGWRVPSKDDYDKLLKFLNAHTDYLKVFKPLRAGFRKEDGTFSLMDEKALFWSATEMTGQGECYVEFSDGNERGLHKCGGMVQNDALSLRCIKDS